MRIDIDLTAGAAYITLLGGEVVRTVAVTERLLVDEDHDGRPVGAEVLGLEQLPVAELLARYELPAGQAVILEALAASWTPPQIQGAA